MAAVGQDLPLQWGYARSVRRQATAQAREAVDLLGHHPSVAVWCGHNEPFKLEIEPGKPFNVAKVGAKWFAGQQLPTWNKTVLDRWIKRSLERNDDSRPVVTHSGVLPHLPLLDGTDSHLYFGWYHGDERDLPRFAATMPRMSRAIAIDSRRMTNIGNFQVKGMSALGETTFAVSKTDKAENRVY